MKIKIDPVKFAPAAAFLYRNWIRSLRFDIEGYEAADAIVQTKRPVIIALWHSELFSLIGFGYIKQIPSVAMASDSKDGQIITEVLERVGYEVARGSSSRGGLKAMLRIVRVMREKGKVGAITVDGPKGPRHKIKPGILAIAQRAGACIIPARAYPSNPVVFNKSWDKFELPKPFHSCKVYFGDPFEVIDQKLDEKTLESEALRLEKMMSQLGK